MEATFCLPGAMVWGLGLSGSPDFAGSTGVGAGLDVFGLVGEWVGVATDFGFSGFTVDGLDSGGLVVPGFFAVSTVLFEVPVCFGLEPLDGLVFTCLVSGLAGAGTGSSSKSLSIWGTTVEDLGLFSLAKRWRLTSSFKASAFFAASDLLSAVSTGLVVEAVGVLSLLVLGLSALVLKGTGAGTSLPSKPSGCSFKLRADLGEPVLGFFVVEAVFG